MAELEAGYKPPSGFVDDAKDPLLELDLSDSTELWLIHLPANPLFQPADFDAKEVKLKLDGDGHLGSFKGTSGKSYDVVSFRSEGPSPMVFSTSTSKTKIAGKISRCVSLIHYPEPSEFQARNNLFGPSSLTTSGTSGRRLPAPTRSVKPRNYPPSSGYSTPSSSKGKSLAYGSEEPSKTSLKRKHSMSRSTEDSAKRGSGVHTSAETSDRSQERKSKKKRKD